jgi:decaprenyl-phosphate phosphoribosyltransferase
VSLIVYGSKVHILSVKSLIKLARPDQYIKNVFIFLPLFFALKITDAELFFNAFLAFISFSLSASAVYTFNDYHDVREDRKHPTKKNRPLAAGTVSEVQAIIMMVILSISGLILMALVSFKAAAILIGYFLINIAYSYSFKHIAIVDISIIAIGFILRLFIGSIVIDDHLHEWLIIMTFLLALFIALAKRRADVMIFLETGKRVRLAIDGYNLQFLNTAMAIMASVVIVAYTNYIASPQMESRFESEYLYLTTFFVIVGIMRFLKLTLVDHLSGSPTKVVYTDLFMKLILLGWVISFTWIIYS